MPDYDFRTPRLFVDHPLAAGTGVPLLPPQSHYLVDVLRMKAGDGVLSFNGRDGEWRCVLAQLSKKLWGLEVNESSRVQTLPGDVHYLFAPLKRARLDYMVQKAVEMGASLLAPVITRHTQAERIKVERIRANVIEAAEQCGVLALPDVAEPVAFERAVAALDPARLLVFCDEGAEHADPVSTLAAHRTGNAAVPVAVIVGPEGGFAAEERAVLLARSNTVRISLGPRILRADTAAVAALAVVQSALGDWR
jgi:16S rRNA (uracil1498-N3)-methyltransferase